MINFVIILLIFFSENDLSSLIKDVSILDPNLQDDVAVFLLVELEPHVRREGRGRRVLGPGVHDAGGDLTEGVVAAGVDLALRLVRHAALLQGGGHRWS